jgi:hypothetical protein
MRNTLSTAHALADCDHSRQVEPVIVNGTPLLRCTTCGARTEPADPASPEQATWKRTELVERLERDVSEELPVFTMELDEAERAGNEIVHSLEIIRNAERSGVAVDPAELSAIIEAARGWCAAVARLRDTLDRGRGE